MPLVNVFTSAEPPPPDKADALLLALSRSVAAELGKSESHVMTCLVPRTRMTFGGTLEPACYVEVKSIGVMTPAQTSAISAVLCAHIADALGVPQDRIYIELADAEEHLWGWNGSTFAD